MGKHYWYGEGKIHAEKMFRMAVRKTREHGADPPEVIIRKLKESPEVQLLFDQVLRDAILHVATE